METKQITPEVILVCEEATNDLDWFYTEALNPSNNRVYNLGGYNLSNAFNRVLSEIENNRFPIIIVKSVKEFNALFNALCNSGNMNQFLIFATDNEDELQTSRAYLFEYSADLLKVNDDNIAQIENIYKQINDFTSPVSANENSINETLDKFVALIKSLGVQVKYWSEINAPAMVSASPFNKSNESIDKIPIFELENDDIIIQATKNKNSSKGTIWANLKKAEDISRYQGKALDVYYLPNMDLNTKISIDVDSIQKLRILSGIVNKGRIEQLIPDFEEFSNTFFPKSGNLIISERDLP